MICKCPKCKEIYERFNIGDYSTEKEHKYEKKNANYINQGKYLLILIIGILFSVSLINAVTLNNGTIINEYSTNSTIQLNNDCTLTSLNINETLGRIIFNSISSNYCKFTNINNTYRAKAGFYNSVDNSLVYLQNGTGWFNENNLNVTIGQNNYSIFLPSFNCSESLQTSSGFPCGRENSPINIHSHIQTSGSITYYISSNLTSPITIPASLTLPDNYVISNIQVTPEGSSSYTPNYSILGNDLIINDLNLSNSDSNQVDLDLETQGHSNACTDSVNSFISYVSLLGLLGAIVFISLVVGYLLNIIDKERFKQISIISTLITLILVGVLIIIGIFIISTMCSI